MGALWLPQTRNQQDLDGQSAVTSSPTWKAFADCRTAMPCTGNVGSAEPVLPRLAVLLWSRGESAVKSVTGGYCLTAFMGSCLQGRILCLCRMAWAPFGWCALSFNELAILVPVLSSTSSELWVFSQNKSVSCSKLKLPVPKSWSKSAFIGNPCWSTQASYSFYQLINTSAWKLLHPQSGSKNRTGRDCC